VCAVCVCVKFERRVVTEMLYPYVGKHVCVVRVDTDTCTHTHSHTHTHKTDTSTHAHTHTCSITTGTCFPSLSLFCHWRTIGASSAAFHVWPFFQVSSLKHSLPVLSWRGFSESREKGAGRASVSTLCTNIVQLLTCSSMCLKILSTKREVINKITHNTHTRTHTHKHELTHTHTHTCTYKHACGHINTVPKLYHPAKIVFSRGAAKCGQKIK